MSKIRTALLCVARSVSRGEDAFFWSVEMKVQKPERNACRCAYRRFVFTNRIGKNQGVGDIAEGGEHLDQSQSEFHG